MLLTEFIGDLVFRLEVKDIHWKNNVTEVVVLLSM